MSKRYGKLFQLSKIFDLKKFQEKLLHFNVYELYCCEVKIVSIKIEKFFIRNFDFVQMREKTL